MWPFSERIGSLPGKRSGLRLRASFSLAIVAVALALLTGVVVANSRTQPVLGPSVSDSRTATDRAAAAYVTITEMQPPAAS
jgi:hypothetical protein